MAQRTEAAGSVALKDGRRVTIRPLTEEDRGALAAFGQSLPKNDLLYLEDDFSNPDIIARLAFAARAENWRQYVAVTDDGAIVAWAAALRMPGWSHHVADIRLIVGPSCRRSGLGMYLAQAIVEAARELGAAKVTVDMLAAQTAGQAIFSRLGFAVEGQLARHAIDRDGNLHDIVIMSAFMKP
ncbi:MAG: GNAT family N-acetyltransferase [Chloroflexi bacterium OHK40]